MIDQLVRAALVGAVAGAVAQRVNPQPPSSRPVHTEVVGDVALTVISVTVDGQTSFQVYAVSGATWELVAIRGLWTDALIVVNQWRDFLAHGGTLSQWRQANPDGCEVR